MTGKPLNPAIGTGSRTRMSIGYVFSSAFRPFCFRDFSQIRFIRKNPRQAAGPLHDFEDSMILSNFFCKLSIANLTL